MDRRILGVPLANIVLTLGVVWGIAMFLIGLAGSFVLGSVQFYANLIALIFGFLAVLPISLAAIWKPRVFAGCLLVSFLIFECAFFTVFGLRDVFLVALLMGLPTGALAYGYIYVASVRAKLQAVDLGGSH